MILTGTQPDAPPRLPSWQYRQFTDGRSAFVLYRHSMREPAFPPAVRRRRRQRQQHLATAAVLPRLLGDGSGASGGTMRVSCVSHADRLTYRVACLAGGDWDHRRRHPQPRERGPRVRGRGRERAQGQGQLQHQPLERSASESHMNLRHILLVVPAERGAERD
jgi:hypothetical protein